MRSEIEKNRMFAVPMHRHVRVIAEHSGADFIYSEFEDGKSNLRVAMVSANIA